MHRAHAVQHGTAIQCMLLLPYLAQVISIVDWLTLVKFYCFSFQPASQPGSTLIMPACTAWYVCLCTHTGSNLTIWLSGKTGRRRDFIGN